MRWSAAMTLGRGGPAHDAMDPQGDRRDPGVIGESYKLDGTVIDPAFSQAFMAPFAVAAMSAGGCARRAGMADALWEQMVATPPQGYYPDSIKLQVMLAMGGWWSPVR